MWEAAQATTISQAVPPTDPQIPGAWRFGGTGVDLGTRSLMISLWGPPQQLTLSLGKTDVWDRRRYFEPPVTLAEIKERVARGDVPKPADRAALSWCAYDFPCSKPVGQIIVRCPDLEDTEQPTAVIQCRDGRATVETARGRLTWLPMMTRNLIAIHGDLHGLENALSLRLYRHRDINGWNTSVQGAMCNGNLEDLPTPEPWQGYDYGKDTNPPHDPIEPPTSGSDGTYFWIRQRLPAEKTFPDGFEYVMVGRVVEPAAALETVEGERGLGTPPFLRPDLQDFLAEKRLKWKALPNYEPIRKATGAAATAALPQQESLRFTFLVSIVTSGEALDPLEEAKRRLAAAEGRDFDDLVAENADWHQALYHRREQGRLFQGSAEFAKEQVREAFRSWTLPHPFPKVCDPDPTRFEGQAAYMCMEQDWDIVHGLWGFAEFFFTPEHVRGRSDRMGYYYKLAGFWLPTAMKNAREVFGLPGATFMQGYFPPILADECTHQTSTWEFSMELPAQFLRILWDCFDYGGDECFLGEVVYPALRETAIFYAGYVSLGDDGRYHVIPTVSSEHWGWTPDFERSRDSTSALCMFKWLLDKAAVASEILGQDADLRERWQEIAGKMAAYPTWDTPDGPIFTDQPGVNPLEYDYRQLFPGVYPCELADEFNLDSTREEKKMMLRSARMVKGQNCARIPALLAAEKGIENPEQLINSRSGRIHLFPGVPESATISFRGMRARGGFGVSAECVSGEVTCVRVDARRDATCRLMNPWPGSPVVVEELPVRRMIRHELDTRCGECIVFQAEQGCAYEIIRARREE